MLTAPRRPNYPPGMEQLRSGEKSSSAAGEGAVPTVSDARNRVDTALSRLESMVDERLRAEVGRADELAERLARLERQHEDLKKVAIEVEGRLERAMEYIRSLLAVDQA